MSDSERQPLLHVVAVALHSAIQDLAKTHGEEGVPMWSALPVDHKRAMYVMAADVLEAQKAWAANGIDHPYDSIYWGVSTVLERESLEQLMEKPL